VLAEKAESFSCGESQEERIIIVNYSLIHNARGDPEYENEKRKEKEKPLLESFIVAQIKRPTSTLRNLVAADNFPHETVRPRHYPLLSSPIFHHNHHNRPHFCAEE